MKKEIIINASSSDIRVAITEDARLAELFLELPDKERHVGSIYLGRVERVVQGMNAAFVDIGLEQHAFLHFSDAAKAGEDFSDLLTEDDEDEVEEKKPAKKGKGKPSRDQRGKGEREKQEKKPQEKRREEEASRDNRAGEKEAQKDRGQGQSQKSSRHKGSGKPSKQEKREGEERESRDRQEGRENRREDQRNRDGKREEESSRSGGEKVPQEERSQRQSQKSSRRKGSGKSSQSQQQGRERREGEERTSRDRQEGEVNRREEQRDRDGKRPSQDGRDQRREEPRQHKPDTKEATSDRERDPNTRDGGQEERGESSQKKSSSRRRRPKRRGPRDGEQRRSEENGGATQTAEEKTSTSVGEKSESDRPNREQPQISAGEGETRPDSQPQQKRSSSKRRRPKSRKASSESSAATQAEAGREEKPEARRETGEARRSEGGKEEQKNRQPRKEGERSGGRENDRREASSPLPEATATPVGEGGEKSKSESGSGEEKAAVATKSSRKKSSRRKATPKPKSEAKEQVEGTEKKESTEKPSPDSGTKEKEPDQPSQKEKKAAAPRTARKSRAKKGTKKSGAEEKSADSKAEAKKESGESKPAQENQEQKGESKPKDSGESSQTSAKASPRRRSAKRSSAKKKKSGGDSEGSGSPRTMDAQLPTFQTKRFGEITISLERGQEILTQVTRESYASKGVKVSTKISLPGRFLVLMPLDPGVGISRKVQDPKERRRLRGIARKMLPEGFGCIIRTVAQDKDSEMLEQELQMLLDRWKVIDEKMRKAKAPLLLYKDQSVANTVMRDLFTPDVSRVVIDNKALHQEICDYVSWAAPSLLSKIEHFSGKNPIFQQFGIEKELDKMMSSKVWLSAGGYIILEQTEAMMVIDVNSGRYAKEKEQELNALKINLESAREIARQIRLRDIGGLLVIDFIDLYDEKNRKKVYDELKKELSRDRAKSVVLPMTQFGIVQMTRQRVRQQLVQTMSEPCPTCKGKGIVQSKSTILRRIERWLGSFRSDTREFRLTLTANPHVIDFLTEGDAMSRLTKLMLKHFVRIKVVPDESLDMEDFRFFSIRRQEDITQEYMEK